VCSIARRSDLGDPADQLLDTVRQRRPGKRRQPDALHASTPDLQWISDSYTLVFAALLVLAGVLGTRSARAARSPPGWPSSPPVRPPPRCPPPARS